MMLKHITVGTKVCNVGLYPGAGGVCVEPPALFCRMYSESLRTVALKLCSGKLRLFSAE